VTADRRWSYRDFDAWTQRVAPWSFLRSASRKVTHFALMFGQTAQSSPLFRLCTRLGLVCAPSTALATARTEPRSDGSSRARACRASKQAC